MEHLNHSNEKYTTKLLRLSKKAASKQQQFTRTRNKMGCFWNSCGQSLACFWWLLTGGRASMCRERKLGGLAVLRGSGSVWTWWGSKQQGPQNWGVPTKSLNLCDWNNITACVAALTCVPVTFTITHSTTRLQIKARADNWKRRWQTAQIRRREIKILHVFVSICQWSSALLKLKDRIMV